MTADVNVMLSFILPKVSTFKGEIIMTFFWESRFLEEQVMTAIRIGRRNNSGNCASVQCIKDQGISCQTA